MDMKKCEHIDSMVKVYSKPPKQTDTSCEGFRNPYTGKSSHKCARCECFIGIQEQVS